MANTPTFEVIALSLFNGAGPVKGLATVRLSGLITISECRIVKAEGEPARVLLPQKTFLDDDGGRRFSTLVEFHERSWRAALTAAVLEAWRDHPDGILPLGSRRCLPPPQLPPTFHSEVRRRAGLTELQT